MSVQSRARELTRKGPRVPSEKFDNWMCILDALAKPRKVMQSERRVHNRMKAHKHI